MVGSANASTRLCTKTRSAAAHGTPSEEHDMSTLLLTAILAQSLAANPPTVGVIADDLVDYSQWVAPHKACGRGPRCASC